MHFSNTGATTSDGKTPRRTKYGVFAREDTFWHDVLPGTVQRQKFLSKDDLMRVVAWKLGNRGKMRPNYNLVAAN